MPLHSIFQSANSMEALVLDLTYLDNDPNTDPAELTALFTAVGWNTEGQRTTERTARMLEQTRFFVVAKLGVNIVGFGRILPDEYYAHVVDVIVAPECRRRGIASEIIKRIIAHAKDRYIGLSLIDGSGFQALYEKVGFASADPTTDRLMYWQP